MGSLDVLTSICPPPPPPPPTSRKEVEWAATERHIGRYIPGDYKALVRTYGAGSFDRFLWIFQPETKNLNLELVARSQQAVAALSRLDEPETAEFLRDLGYDLSDLLAWGLTDNGDTCFWAVGEDTASWPVLVNESREPEWRYYNRSVTEFVADVMSRREICDIFPEDFPSTRPEFVSWRID